MEWSSFFGVLGVGTGLLVTFGGALFLSDYVEKKTNSALAGFSVYFFVTILLIATIAGMIANTGGQ